MLIENKGSIREKREEDSSSAPMKGRKKKGEN